MYVHDKCGNVFKSVYKMTLCEIAYQFDIQIESMHEGIDPYFAWLWRVMIDIFHGSRMIHDSLTCDYQECLKAHVFSKILY